MPGAIRWAAQVLSARGSMSSQVEQRDSGIWGYPRHPEPGDELLSTRQRPDQRTRSNLTANPTKHLPDWPAKMSVKC